MSKVISADVSDDLAERIEAEQEDGESRSATVRRLVRRGLDHDRHPFVVPVMMIGSLSIGIAVDPVAAPELFVALGLAIFLLAGAIQSGVFDR